MLTREHQLHNLTSLYTHINLLMEAVEAIVEFIHRNQHILYHVMILIQLLHSLPLC